METRESPETPRLSVGFRIFGVLAGLALLFAAVLTFELLTSDENQPEGGELLLAPRPIIPPSVEGFPVAADPGAATFLSDAYRRGGVPVTGVEAAQIGGDREKGKLAAATVAASAAPGSRQFRGDILLGAAAGYGVQAAQYSSRVRDDVAVYTLVVSEGRLYVWFFSDAFVQLFVPAAIGDRADAMFEAVLRSMSERAHRRRVMPWLG